MPDSGSIAGVGAWGGESEGGLVLQVGKGSESAANVDAKQERREVVFALADDAVDGAVEVLDAGESDVLGIAVRGGVARQAGVEDGGAAGGVDGGDAAVAEPGAGLGQKQAAVGSEGDGAGMVQAGKVDVISAPGEQIGATAGAGGEGRDGEAAKAPARNRRRPGRDREDAMDMMEGKDNGAGGRGGEG